MVLKIILLDHQNNYVGLKLARMLKLFAVLLIMLKPLIILIVQQNYFQIHI